jgi:predicted transcriptional regulator
MRPLTRAESELMNLLWDQPQGVIINDLVALYPEPQPARTTVATFLKILEAKGYVEHRRLDGTGRTFIYSPLLTRERYVTCVLRDVKDTMFGSSVKKMLSFFVQNEEISDEELRDILKMIDDTNNQTL